MLFLNLFFDAFLILTSCIGILGTNIGEDEDIEMYALDEVFNNQNQKSEGTEVYNHQDSQKQKIINESKKKKIATVSKIQPDENTAQKKVRYNFSILIKKDCPLKEIVAELLYDELKDCKKGQATTFFTPKDISHAELCKFINMTIKETSIPLMKNLDLLISRNKNPDSTKVEIIELYWDQIYSKINKQDQTLFKYFTDEKTNLNNKIKNEIFDHDNIESAAEKNQNEILSAPIGIFASTLAFERLETELFVDFAILSTIAEKIKEIESSKDFIEKVKKEKKLEIFNASPDELIKKSILSFKISLRKDTQYMLPLEMPESKWEKFFIEFTNLYRKNCYCNGTSYNKKENFLLKLYYGKFLQNCLSFIKKKFIKDMEITREFFNRVDQESLEYSFFFLIECIVEK